MAGFLARALGGPLAPEAAAAIAAATPAERLPDGEVKFDAVERTPGGIRALADLARPGALRPSPEASTDAEPGP